MCGEGFGRKQTMSEILENCRKCTRAIAFLELVVSIFMLLLALLAMMDTSFLYNSGTLQPSQNGTSEFRAAFCHQEDCSNLYIFMLIFTLESGFHLLAAVSLLSSTEPNADVSYVLECTRFWRKVTFLLYLQYLVFLLVENQWPYAVLLFVFRFFIHCEVEAFKETLKQANGPPVASSQPQNVVYIQEHLHAIIIDQNPVAVQAGQDISS